MTVETALWIVGAACGPLIGWVVHVTILITRNREDIKTLMIMHRKPDEYGFGTATTNRIIEDNTRAMNALTHYIKWLVKDQTGRTPPPPTGSMIPKPVDESD